MKIHHLDCCTMRPPSERLIHGHGSWLGHGHMVAHCLLIETGEGLVLVDSGIGLDDVRDPLGRLGKPFMTVVRPLLDPARTAAGRIEALGLSRRDVRHVVLTHLDLDHAGGLADFPEAEVHVYRAEHAAAMSPSWKERERYRACHFQHGPKWVLHDVEGERFLGLQAVQAIVEPEVLLVPTTGHTRGHAAVAVRSDGGWLLHCGDAYFSAKEMEEPPSCPGGLGAFQRLVAMDDRARRDNQDRLRQLRRGHPEVRVFSAHDRDELEAFL
jgi:glyoxylase-like metal-dependent hydrolase (beta-lactamase superfamily II)